MSGGGSALAAGSGPSTGSWAPDPHRSARPMTSTGEPAFDRAYTTRVMLILTGLVMVVLYVEGMLTPSLQTIANDFQINYDQVTLLISAYAVSGVALSPVVGKLGDIYGKRKVLIVVILAYSAAVSVTGFSPTFTFMVVSRTIQGIGLTIIPLGMALIREEFPREMVPKAQGILSAMFGVGFAISLPLGSWVSQTYGWRYTYHSAIPVVILLALAVIFVVRESRYARPEVKVDYPGAALLGGSLGLIVIALSMGQAWGWLSAGTLWCLVDGVALLVPFALWESHWKHQGRDPIIDQRLLANRNVAVTNTVLTVAGLGMYMALVALIYRFEYGPLPFPGAPNPSHGFSQSIFQSGLDIVPLALAMLAMAPVVAFTVSKVGVKPYAILGTVVTALGFFLSAFATTLDQALAYEAVVGVGLALLNASIINLLVLTVDPKDMGQATAMNNVFRNVGGSVGAPIVGSLTVTYVTAVATPFGTIDQTSFVAFQYAFWIAAAVTVASGLVILFAHEVLGPRAVAGRKAEERAAVGAASRALPRVPSPQRASPDQG